MADNSTQYIFSPITGQRLTLGYCLDLIEKVREARANKEERYDLELGIAWHNALACARGEL